MVWEHRKDLGLNAKRKDIGEQWENMYPDTYKKISSSIRTYEIKHLSFDDAINVCENIFLVLKDFYVKYKSKEEKMEIERFLQEVIDEMWILNCNKSAHEHHKRYTDLINDVNKEEEEESTFEEGFFEGLL